MEKNNDYTSARLSRWLEDWKHKADPKAALLARAALTDACEALLAGAENEKRGMTPTEQRAFDTHAMQARELTESLAAFRRAAEA